MSNLDKWLVGVPCGLAIFGLVMYFVGWTVKISGL